MLIQRNIRKKWISKRAIVKVVWYIGTHKYVYGNLNRKKYIDT